MSSTMHTVERARRPEVPARQHSLAGPATLLHRRLLLCGIASSALYVAADIMGALLYPGYSYADHTFSELLATGTPVRMFMIALNTVPYTLLVTAFAAGLWSVAGTRRAARITAVLLVGYAVTGMVTGIAFPMHTREALAAGAAGFRNAMHPVGTGVMSLVLLVGMGFGATLLGRRFRSYTYITIIVLLVFGLLTSKQAGAMTANLPTPWMGGEERINIYATMLWVALLAVGLRRAGTGRPHGVQTHRRPRTRGPRIRPHASDPVRPR